MSLPAAMVLRDSVSVVREHLAEWDVPHVDLSLFGTADPEAITALVDRFCRQQLGARVEGYLFCSASVGVTHGLRLSDGRDVVLKGHQPRRANPDLHLDPEALGTVCAVQQWLHDQGFPCPELLQGPRPLGLGSATVERYLWGPRVPDGFCAADRGTIAADLARLVALLRALPFSAARLRPFRAPEGALYPRPHSRLFDFSLPTELAPAVDAIARRAAALHAQGGPAVLGHGDWRVEHLRYDGTRLVAVYDWDSLASTMEVDLVGQAAHAFTSDWSREGHRQLPGPEDITAFVGDYERARGAPFTRDQRRGLFARVVSSMAYGARCQLSMHPARQGWPEDTFVHLVLTAAEDLLVAA